MAWFAETVTTAGVVDADKEAVSHEPPKIPKDSELAALLETFTVWLAGALAPVSAEKLNDEGLKVMVGATPVMVRVTGMLKGLLEVPAAVMVTLPW